MNFEDKINFYDFEIFLTQNKNIKVIDLITKLVKTNPVSMIENFVINSNNLFEFSVKNLRILEFDRKTFFDLSIVYKLGEKYGTFCYSITSPNGVKITKKYFIPKIDLSKLFEILSECHPEKEFYLKLKNFFKYSYSW